MTLPRGPLNVSPRRLFRLAVVLAVVLANSGCGARVSPDPVVADVPVPAEANARSEEGTATGPDANGDGAYESSQAAPVGSPGDPSQPRPGPVATRGRAHNTVFTITMSANCVQPGRTIVARMRGPRNAALGMVAAYGHDSEQRQPGPMNVAKSDARGQYDWLIVVAPGAKLGRAAVLAGSTGPDEASEGGGTADAFFTVATTC